MEIYYPVDIVIGEGDLNPRLPVEDIRELNSQMAANLFACDDESELWFDEEITSEMIRVIDEIEFIEMECGV